MNCYICNKNIDLLNFKCKCEKNFCIKHYLPEKHKCKFDYRKENKKKLEKNNPIIINEKISKI